MHDSIVRKGERLVIEIELVKDIDVWENNALILQSLFEGKVIGEEFRVSNIFFDTDGKVILLQHLQQVRSVLDEIEIKLKNSDNGELE